MRLWSSVLLCCVCLLSAAASDDSDDWIDPFDMENYDAGTQTMRKPSQEIKKPADVIIPKSSTWKSYLEQPVLQLSVALVVVSLSILWLARRRRHVAPAADPQAHAGQDNVAGGDAIEQHREDNALLQANQPEGPHGVEENNGGDPQGDIGMAEGRPQMPFGVQERISVEETSPSQHAFQSPLC